VDDRYRTLKKARMYHPLVQKIVTIGGGTGQFQILRGLKNYECSVTAIVNMSDDGKSSGKLRDEYGVLPPGDVRQCMVALADDEHAQILRDLFNFRFKDGHSLGNLIITALAEITGSSAEGIKEAAKLIKVKGKVLPVTADSVTLSAKTEDGRTLDGQDNVSYPEGEHTKITQLMLEPEAFLFKDAGEAIREADKIVICPGDLYGSILPNFCIKGMKEALQNSSATKIYVCNMFTKEGNFNFKALDFVKEIEKYSGCKMDHIIISQDKPDQAVLDKYFTEHSKLVEDDLGDDPRALRADLAKVYPSEAKTILRHVPEKIARAIVSL